MPIFVIFITILSLFCLRYALSLLTQEMHQMHRAVEPFGGTLGHITQHVVRLTLALVFSAAGLMSVLLSGALVWLTQFAQIPAMTGL